METALRVCANCRVLVQPCEGGWEHVPEFAEKFTRAICETPAEGRTPSGSEIRFGMARMKTPGGDKLSLRGELGELALPAGTPITVATDGSYKLTVGEKVIKPMSWSYLTTNGLYGVGTSMVPGKLIGEKRWLQAELRAIAAALKAVGSDHPVTLLSDSKAALDMIFLWRDGHQVMPRDYDLERSGGRESTLARLAQRVYRDRDLIEPRWIRGHSGHPLNEAADTLAKMARAWAAGELTRDDVALRAPQVALVGLNNYALSAAA
jgi:ribonuclease HI